MRAPQLSLSHPQWRLGAWLCSMLIFVIVAVAVYHYPLGTFWASVGLLAYAGVLWRYPLLALPAVLAMLPLLNFAPWTGWILLDEFDLLIAVTLVVRLLQQRPDTGELRLAGIATLALALLAVSFFASALVGLIPFSPLDHNALSGYYSSFNSLRVLKGFAWALALLPLIVEEMRRGRAAELRFVAGMVAGLCGVVAVSVWQRAVFTGLLDFVKEYRITATFPEMHTGGGYVETYLAAAIPFTVAWIMLKPGIVRFVPGAMLFICASYALAVTYARAGYLAYAGALIVAGAVVFIYWSRSRAWKPRHIAAAALVLAAAVVVMVSVLTASYMQSRLASVRGDAATRTQHWSDAAGMMNDGWKSMLIGMGLGSFPRTYLLKNPHGVVPQTFSYLREEDNVFLRLGSGDALYLTQHVDVVAATTYVLSLYLRSSTRNARLRAYLCENALLYSFRCRSVDVGVASTNGSWEHHEVALNSGDVGQGSWPMRRPVAVALYHPGRGTLDIDNVRLLHPRGFSLIANGDFSKGGNRWYFSTDNHLPWHIKHLWVQILFEQGWFGIFAVGFAVILAMARLAVQAWRGDLFGGTLLASVSAFMMLGFFDSTFDVPRLTTLLFILLFVALSRAGLQRAPLARPRQCSWA